MLLGNYSIINNLCGRAHSGISNPYNFIGPHKMMGIYAPSQYESTLSQLQKGSIPAGTEPPYSLLIAIKGGGLSSTTYLAGNATITGSSAMGINIASNLAGVGDITSAMGLISSLATTLSGTGDLTASMVSSLSMAANLAGSGDITGALNLLVEITVSMGGSGTLTSNLTGTATLEASITPFTTLSPENLASAVLGSLIEGSYTFQDCIKILTAVAAGKTTIIDLGGGSATVTFRDINDTEDRVVADMTNSERDTVTITT
jgi:hypothetical protein